MRRVALSLACLVIAACSGADFGQFSGAQKEDDQPPADGGTDGAADAADAADSDEGTDIPTWINGAYLTCDWQDIPSETEVKVRCGLYGQDGDEELPSGLSLKVAWKFMDENGKPVDVSKILKSDDPTAHIVSIQVPIETFAKWTISAAFGGGGVNREIGKKMQETLGGGNEKLNGCFKKESGVTSCFFKEVDENGGTMSWSSSSSSGGASASSDDVVDPAVLATAHKVFVTSEKFNGAMGGREGANSKCQLLATTAGLSGTWKAILAGDGEPIQQSLNLTHAIVNLRPAANGGPQLVAQSIEAITTFGTLENAVRFDESGKPGDYKTPRNVWTGAKGNGQALPGSTCGNWNQASGPGRQGGGNRMSAQWLNLVDADCGTPASLYCIDGQ